ncbi:MULTISPECIES: CynX/NimT family MFS transporter [Staphylococcus]|jgi:CP family cyanate transporter-like MFS transporter|uniref:ABC transporter permease n=1 Tax=Staphylococcus nepalensis TaxID=214473 RepID=A0A380GP24_9STAP|nr:MULTISPECIES: MFS transporter [Staphylococcus]VDG68142.1 inner membrane transport protein YeaN [Lacrimispora indolis]AWI45539.1 permease [Staphylococcus nepalensis]MBO1205909.1 MFS transporter [Staphylococcus nepalensis]MBO1214569.1 MFS transporter [Staphylococcus nepalensis]MBO1216602.1 MFS transporter [Staphylococcus nepalensis]
MTEPYRIHRIKENWGVILAIVFIASTLRAPLTSVGPVVDEIKHVMEINNSVAGILTTIPLIIFAVVSPLVSRVTARLTMSRTILYSTILLIIGLYLRVAGDFTLFIIGTLVLGIAIAFGNVVLPSYVKWYFPMQIGVATGIYSGTMNFTAGLGGGLSFPLSQSPLGFRLSLSFWIILAIIAIILWIPKARSGAKLEKQTIDETQWKQHKKINIAKSKLAWMVALTMGFQSMVFYTVVAWVPSILVDRGLDPSTAGYLLMLNQFSQVPMTFTFPIIASKLKDQRILVVIITILFLVGFGLFFTQSLVLLIIGIIIAGLAMGACFSLCMTFFSIRARTSDGSISLSGFGQSVGYLIAAVGPFLIGYLHDFTGSWVSGIIALLLMAVLFFIFGYPAAKNRVVEDE